MVSGAVFDGPVEFAKLGPSVWFHAQTPHGLKDKLEGGGKSQQWYAGPMYAESECKPCCFNVFSGVTGSHRSW